MNSIATWVAIASFTLLIAVFAIGLNTRPGPEHWPRPAAAGPQLPPIVPFAPSASFEGEHKYGLWTLYCRPGVAGADIGAAPGAPASPDLEADLPTQLDVSVRCVAHARIQVRAAGVRSRTLAYLSVLSVGVERKPFVIMKVPAKAAAGKIVHFQIDQNTMFTAPVGACAGASCAVEGELPAAALTQMLAGKEFLLRLYPEGSDGPVDFGYPLHGFKQAYEGLALAQPLPDPAEAPPPGVEPPPQATGPPVE